MKLETERLILRKPKMSDVEDLVEGLNDLDVATYLGGPNYPYKKEHAKKLIRESTKNWNKKEIKKYSFLIVLKSENKVIGGTNLYGVDKFDGTAGSASWINRKYQRFGYMLEAKIKINEFAFNKLNLRKLKSEAITLNDSSNKLLKKLGYKKEGFLRKEIKSKANKKIYDENLYGLLREDWKKNLPKLKKHLKKKIKKLSKEKEVNKK